MSHTHTHPPSGFSQAEPVWQWLARDLLRTPEQQVRAWLAPRLACTPDAVPLQRTTRGRPHLRTPHGPNFDVHDDVSWSHSGDGLLVAHATHAVVGVDLEWLRPRRRVLAIAGRYFHPAETEWLASQADEDTLQSAFTRLWCAKEAVLKAHGHGLSFGLDRLQFIERNGALHLHACAAALGIAAQWRLRELQPQPGYRAAVAWYPGILPA